MSAIRRLVVVTGTLAVTALVVVPVVALAHGGPSRGGPAPAAKSILQELGGYGTLERDAQLCRRISELTATATAAHHGGGYGYPGAGFGRGGFGRGGFGRG